MENYIDKLTTLQTSIGYNKGEFNAIAILGLIGESGEVLEHVFISDSEIACMQRIAVAVAEALDNVKKEIRDRNFKTENVFYVDPESEHEFDKELADLFYYLNAVAINRGLTLDDLAKMSFEKVSAKLKQSPQ
jgi:NTP pyrophosphatase (non-canonical NTP hydrolase)